MNRRICYYVINQILNEIPTEKGNFINELKKDLDFALYKAPEDNIQWHRVSNTLSLYIKNPVEDWEYKVLSIFTTRSIQELKIIFKVT